MDLENEGDKVIDFLIKIFKALANEQDAPGIKSKLKEIIPEYQPFDLNHSQSSPNQ